MIKAIAIALLFAFATVANSQSIKPWEHGALRVSANGRFLELNDGTPFFLLADTAWRMQNQLTREDVSYYFATRAEQGFNAILFTASNGYASEFNEANVYGRVPFLADGSTKVLLEGDDPESWWVYFRWIVETAAEHGLYVGLTPSFGGHTERFETEAQCEEYGRFLVEWLRDAPNVIWIGGGDLPGSYRRDEYREYLMEVIDRLDPDRLMTYHPIGPSQSSTHYHDRDWLDFNSSQTGHFRRHDPKVYAYPFADWNLAPAKPTVDIEFAYENHPMRQGEGKFDAADIREKAYWSVFAGSAGLGYGHYEVWRFNMNGSEDEPHWRDAVAEAQGAQQLRHLKALMYSRSYTTRWPDLDLVQDSGVSGSRVLGTRASDYAFIYIPNGRSVSVVIAKLTNGSVSASWFDPRSGEWTSAGEYSGQQTIDFNPPGRESRGNDWVLALDFP